MVIHIKQKGKHSFVLIILTKWLSSKLRHNKELIIFVEGVQRNLLLKGAKFKEW
jgi:hypothetical protein